MKNPNNTTKTPKHVWIIISITLISIIAIGEILYSQQKSNKTNTTVKETTELTSTQAKNIIENKAQEALLALKNKDSKKLANLAHPDLGIRFSPYSHVQTKDNGLKYSDLVFTKQQLKNIFEDKKLYIWGTQDGSGLPINMTFTEYYGRYIYSHNFINTQKIQYNKVTNRGSIQNNINDIYPNAITVSFLSPESELDPKYGKLDAKTINLIFEKKYNTWYLVGIINDQWTI